MAVKYQDATAEDEQFDEEMDQLADESAVEL